MSSYRFVAQLPWGMVLVEGLHVDVHRGPLVLDRFRPIGPGCFPQREQVARLDLGPLGMVSSIRILAREYSRLFCCLNVPFNKDSFSDLQAEKREKKSF